MISVICQPLFYTTPWKPRYNAHYWHIAFVDTRRLVIVPLCQECQFNLGEYFATLNIGILYSGTTIIIVLLYR